jgi:hypothetical protein
MQAASRTNFTLLLPALLPVLLSAMTAGAVLAQTTVQIETLTPVRCTEGTAGPVNMVEAGFGDPGVFGGDIVLHWTGMESEGAILEFRIPVAAAGRQRVVVGAAKSWDYGVYQLMINGEDAGDQMDFASGESPEIVRPIAIDLGLHDLKRGNMRLGLRFIGPSPRAQDGPNPGSVAVDYVRLQPEAGGATDGTAGGGATGGGGSGQGGRTFEFEKLEILEASEGTTGETNVVEGGLARAGEFGADTVVHWFGMENPGALLEFRVPVVTSGRYQVTVALVKSWDFGVYQCLVNGKDTGPRLDLASAKEPEHVYPFVIELGTFDLKQPKLTLGFRFEGVSPGAQDGPNPMSGAFDWVRLTPAGPKTGK